MRNRIALFGEKAGALAVKQRPGVLAGFPTATFDSTWLSAWKG
jgi:hypothetical protein